MQVEAWIPDYESYTHYIVLYVLSCILRWVHTCNVTAYRNTVSWQHNVSKVGYAVT